MDVSVTDRDDISVEHRTVVERVGSARAWSDRLLARCTCGAEHRAATTAGAIAWGRAHSAARGGHLTLPA
jgi:hypothetical protein